MAKGDLTKLVEKIYYRFGSPVTVTCLDRIKKLGFYYATVAGISFPITDLIVPKQKDAIITKAEKDVAKVEKMYMDGIITNGERYNKVISIWGHATADVASAMIKNFEELDHQAFLNEDKTFKSFNSIFMMLDSGARSSKDQIKQLVGMRGLMATPTGEIMETPIISNFKDGLSVFEYFISTHGARKGQADTALKTANSGYLTRRLVDVAQDVVVTMHDCKTLGYIDLVALEEGGDVVYPLAKRAFGRVIAADVKDPVSGQLLFKQGDVIYKESLAKIDDSAVTKLLVRSLLACQAKRGICAACYGLDLSKGKLADVGATVGIIAAQSIGEPGTQLTMRTFHIGGTASGTAEQSYFASKHAGVVTLVGVRTVKNKDGQYVVLSRKARLLIESKDGRELQRHQLEYGSILFVEDKQEIAAGTKLAEWDVHNRVILTEYSGKVKFIDLINNVTVQERFDEATQKSDKIILEHREERYQPAVSILDDTGEEVAHYYLPTGAYLAITNGQKIEVGDVLVKMPREISKTKDITGGLPRIAELFEARIPKDPAVMSDIDGEIVFGGLHRGMRKVTVINSYDKHDYFIPRGKQVNVVNNEKVNAGDLLTTGVPVLHDILRIMGPDILQKFLVNQIQEIYRLQGIDINDKHIELIVRQMLRKVRIVDSGDTSFLIGDLVDKIHFKAVNAAIATEGKKVAVAKPMLMGITLASLGTDSFISAASFQETTKILTEAAISGTIDNLYGLKENVIIGKLIPAGTGIASFRHKYIGDDESELEHKARAEEVATVEVTTAVQPKSEFLGA